jgi:hypothetical protein
LGGLNPLEIGDKLIGKFNAVDRLSLWLENEGEVLTLFVSDFG